jgi:predicted dehydrogenase
VGVTDVDPTAAAALANGLGAPALPLPDLIACPDLAAAIVATPPATHAAVARQFLARGISVLCEKPLCIEASEARELHALARQTRCHLVTTTKFRFVPAVQAARDLLASGSVGRVLAARVVFGGHVAVEGTWLGDPAISGGGVVTDNGPHAMDLLIFLGLRPTSLEVAAAWTRASTVEDQAFLQGHTESDALWSVRLSWVSDPGDEDFLVVEAEKATLRVGWRQASMRRRGEASSVPLGSGYDKKEALAGNLIAFRFLLDGQATLLPGEDESLLVVALLERAREQLAAPRDGRVTWH